ncbi:MAG: hypothetical protein ACP5E3_12290, partial [Bacteroidales bacterium]
RIYSSGDAGRFKIIIEDNGIGRALASKINTQGTGRGISIIDKILKLYEKMKDIRIQYEIQDLSDVDGNPIGTRIVIRIPVPDQAWV